MMAASLTVVRDAPPHSSQLGPGTVIAHHDLEQWVTSGRLLSETRRYQSVRLLASQLDVVRTPFLTAVALRLLSRGECYFEDARGRRLVITLPTLALFGGRFLRDFVRLPWLLGRVHADMRRLANQAAPRRMLRLTLAPVYLRTDFVFGLEAGGSVAHIAGVLNHLDEFTGRPVLLTTDRIPGVRSDLETHTVSPGRDFWDFGWLPEWHLNEAFAREGILHLGDRPVAFFYHRYSLNSFVGVRLARTYQVPLVIEYNNSEIWTVRHWGTGRLLKYERLSARAEALCLQAADVVVVVSRALHDELIRRNVDPAKILVNPNGVDSELYSPVILGDLIRQRFEFDGKIVVGFIGTFGRWHGAEVLAEAFARFVAAYPEYRSRLRLLMVGDGVMMPEVRRRLMHAGVMDHCVLTGTVPQAEGPQHLAACDILASPHIPNRDGSAFFGSPTKLFEYMAMGKAIIASELGQIGEVLEHGRTAWLVRPGDSDALVSGLKALLDSPALRRTLGEAARREVVAHYTWREHTRRIVDKIVERCG